MFSCEVVSLLTNFPEELAKKSSLIGKKSKNQKNWQKINKDDTLCNCIYLTMDDIEIALNIA